MRRVIASHLPGLKWTNLKQGKTFLGLSFLVAIQHTMQMGLEW